MAEKTNIAVQIKGVREGLLVTLGEGEWHDLQEALLTHIEEKQSFFQGAKIALDIGQIDLYAADLGTLRDKLSDKGINLWAVVSNSLITERTAQMLGLATRLFTVKPDRIIQKLNTTQDGEASILIQKTIRSGIKIVNEGHVAIIGDVNPGAEIVAGGNVIIWGRLRGSVHAGSEGNEQAVIVGLEMEPTQIRIANIISAPIKRKGKPQPEIARIKEGQVVVEYWNTKEGDR